MRVSRGVRRIRPTTHVPDGHTAALARTATGKLQKFKLREPYWAGRARRVN